MAPRFHTLTVRDVRRETPDCVSIAFEIPDHLRDRLAFQPGQHLVVRTRIDGDEVRRNYSICTNPLDGELRIAVKRLPGGRFSTWASQHLKPGDTLDVLPPSGRFCPSLPTQGRTSYAAFAAGSGITPVISILAHTLASNPDSRFLLVYGNRDRRHIIFRETLEALKNQYLHRLQIIHVLSRETTEAEIHSGHIDARKCQAIDRHILKLASIDACFLCGPAGMVETVSASLRQLGVDPQRIHLERFHAPTTHATASPANLPADDTPASRISLRLDGVTATFQTPRQGPTLLDAAIQAGIDMPFACKGGMCGTCRARLISGQVHMDQPFALEPAEIHDGFILTCQSHPLTDQVSVDFDSR